MPTLTIGPGQQYASIAGAVAAARDGDVLQIQAGTYVNDFATINQKITLQGVGGMAVLKATVSPSNGKAILVTSTDVTLDHVELTGAAVPDGNGAGIRHEGGALLVTNSYIHDNQEGILAGNVPGGSITIRNSEVAHNGTGDGGTHNVYVGRIDSLTIDGSNIHDAVLGHQVKSRADATTITNSVIDDGAGNGSYSVDLPEGGKVVLRDTVLHQGAASANPAIVHFGGEGAPYPGSSLQMDGVKVINDLASPSAAVLLNETDVVAEIANLSVSGTAAAKVAFGLAQILDGAQEAAIPDPAPAIPDGATHAPQDPVQEATSPAAESAPAHPAADTVAGEAHPAADTVADAAHTAADTVAGAAHTAADIVADASGPATVEPGAAHPAADPAPEVVAAQPAPEPAPDAGVTQPAPEPVPDLVVARPAPLPDTFHFPDMPSRAPDPVFLMPGQDAVPQTADAHLGGFHHLHAPVEPGDAGPHDVFSTHVMVPHAPSEDSLFA